MGALAAQQSSPHNVLMLVARSQWLLRLMVLVMAFTGPVQAFASMMQGDISVCPVANTQDSARSAAGSTHHMGAKAPDHCRQMDGAQAVQTANAHDHCGSSCMGNCGACAHCPVGITQFSSAAEMPPQLLIPAVQHRPGDVPPETNLRPPRAFS